MNVERYVDVDMTVAEKVRWLVECAVKGDSIDVVAKEILAAFDGPSDAEVEAAARAIWKAGGPMESGTTYPIRMARAALTAARQAREEGR